MKEDIDILVQTPLELEFNQFLGVFSNPKNLGGAYLTYRVDAPNGLNVVVTLQGDQGKSEAAKTCVAALNRFKPKLMVCLGIAGGLSKDVAIGDVCYTGNLIDALENTKITDHPTGGLEIDLKTEHFETPFAITSAMGFVRTMPEMRPMYSRWREDQLLYAWEQGLSTFIGRGGQSEDLDQPNCINGQIVCGPVTESSTYVKKLSSVHRNILAIETESGAIFSECKRGGIPAISIRGVSDYADSNKGAIEASSRGKIRDFAARNASTFLKLQMESELFVKAILNSDGVAEDDQIPLFENARTRGISELLQDLSQDIHSNLRELSPQYKMKPENYRLPTPRLKENSSKVLVDDKAKATSVELLVALSQSSRLFVYVPRTYPDPALSWIMASGLLSKELDGRRIIPVVVSGSRLSPPAGTPFSKSEVALIPDISLQGGKYVYIIDEPHLKSRTRLSHLIRVIKGDKDSSYILLSREDKSLVEESGILREVTAQSFDLCNVSFAEIASFIEQSLDMSGAEAEVIALKLRDTFKSFSLPAHPSFFAGIPLEMITALLGANRRSEIIQLAVDGFLSFLVASDEDTVRLSRSKRSQFLRSLVIKMEVEKVNFTQASVIEFADDLNKIYDYRIQPLSFIESFVSKGLLHFEDGYVRITLPFMRSYLLADELAKSPQLAKSYFDLTSEDFDYLTFYLYSEIGASDEICNGIIDGLVATNKEIRPDNFNNILVGSALSPSLLKKPAQLRGFEQRVSEARTALEEGHDQREAKAAMLDIYDRVSDEIKIFSNKNDADRTQDENPPAEAYLFQYWRIATVLLGSGAESITGDKRRQIVAELLTSADLICDLLTRKIAEVDFDEIRNQILQDEQFREDVGADSPKQFNEIITTFVDLVQYASIGQPFAAVATQLLDQAQHLIIGHSIAGVKGNTQMEELLRGLWLAHIDPKEGASVFGSAIKNLPRALFLRSLLVSLLIYRVKWSVAGKGARQYLIDAAEELVKPINGSFDKGGLERFLKRLDKESTEPGYEGD